MATPPLSLQLEGQFGEIRIAGMRFCLLDIETSFYHLRTSVEEVIGPAAATIFYESGYRGGLRYGAAILKQRLMSADAAGYRKAIHEYSEGGFGDFEVKELDFRAGRAVIGCIDPPSFEAFACIANSDPRKHPVCDFSRGVFAGLLCAFTMRDDLGCVEERCRARGDPECFFRVDLESATEEASLEQWGISASEAPARD